MEISFARHQFPPDIIRHAVWLYLRFTLSLRDVEDLLAERGLDVSYETIRRWVLKFGPLFAKELRRRRHRPTSKWQMGRATVLNGGRCHAVSSLPAARRLRRCGGNGGPAIGIAPASNSTVTETGTAHSTGNSGTPGGSGNGVTSGSCTTPNRDASVDGDVADKQTY
jgi:hypothetical protein